MPRKSENLSKNYPNRLASKGVRFTEKASGSVGANHIEANESLGKKDFRMRVKISRKEAKESRYWLRLVDTFGGEELEIERAYLIQESTELMNIFGSILQKSK